MDYLYEAIATNNMGVQLFNKGNIAASLSTFQRAVDLLTVCSAQGRFFHGTNPFSSSPCRSVIFWSEQETPDTSVAIETDSSYYIYRRPLLLPTPGHLTNHEDLDSIILSASSSVIFNMAIACHLYGEASGQEQYWSRAGRLYDTVLRMLSTTHEISYDVLKCLILNNRAHLYSQQCNIEGNKWCAEILHHLLSSTDSLVSYFDVDEVDEIRLNIMYLQNHSAAGMA